MNIQLRPAVSAIRPIGLVVLLWLVPLANAQAGETISATARVTTAGGVAATAPVSIITDRFSTDAERDAVLAALKKGGTEAVRSLLLTHPPIGSLKVGNESTVIKYAYARPTGSPIAFLGAGAPGAKPKDGFYLGLATLQMAASGAGRGELMPATKVRLNDQGAIVTEDYSAEVVQLSNVVGK
jgi:hypothetical protein